MAKKQKPASKHEILKKFRHPDKWEWVLQPGDDLPEDLSDEFKADMASRGRIKLADEGESEDK